MLRVATAVLLLVALTVGEIQKPYEGHKLIRVKANTEYQLKTVHQLQLDNALDFWTEPRKLGMAIDIRVPPKKYKDVTTLFKQHNIAYEVVRENIQEGVDKEMARLAERYRTQGDKAFNIDDFNNYEDTQQWLQTIAGQCATGVTCRIYSIGKSYEGRDLNVLHISTGAGKKAFWMDSAIHAREWLAPATVLKIINRIVTEYSSNADVKRLVDTYDWYFLPTMNPDGYKYSWESERFWRKSRNVNADSPCMGTDLNRNYDIEWMHDGTSSDPCSDTYGGSSGGSEPETQAVQNELKRLGPNMRAFITVHTAALMWLHPYGYTDDATGACARTPTHERINQVANAAANAAENNGGQVWQRGTSCETIYPSSGGTDDYAYAKAGIKYSFTPELRGPGFDPPSSEIEPSFNENWAALVAIESEITNIEGTP